MLTDRRNFLARIVLAVNGVLLGAFAGIANVYLFWGSGSRKGRWTYVARLDGLEVGAPRQVEYQELVPDAWATIRRRKNVWLVRDGEDQVAAFDPNCTHLGCPYGWDGERGAFVCPCHGGVFDIEGQVLEGPPPRPLDRLEVQVEAGEIRVRTDLS